MLQNNNTAIKNCECRKLLEELGISSKESRKNIFYAIELKRIKRNRRLKIVKRSK